MSHADLSAARWRELSDESAMSVARVIARENQLDLVEVRGHDYAGRYQRIALFERAGMRFSLVPADHVALGYLANSLSGRLLTCSEIDRPLSPRTERAIDPAPKQVSK